MNVELLELFLAVSRLLSAIDVESASILPENQNKVFKSIRDEVERSLHAWIDSNIKICPTTGIRTIEPHKP